VTASRDASNAGLRAAPAAHDLIIRGAIEAHGGWLFKHTGDGVCAAFAAPLPRWTRDSRNSTRVFEFCSGLVDLVVGVGRHGGGGHRLALAGERFVGLAAEDLSQVGDRGAELGDPRRRQRSEREPGDGGRRFVASEPVEKNGEDRLYSAWVSCAVTATPHLLRNFEFGGSSVPHDVHANSVAVMSSPWVLPYTPRSRVRLREQLRKVDERA
jgi:class 3 adenylate cyclase